MTTPTPDPRVNPGDRASSVLRVLRDQRKTILVALGLAVAAFWIAGQLGEWPLAGCIAGGIGLGLVNHLATEYWLLKIITSGEQPTRNQMIARPSPGSPCSPSSLSASRSSSGPTASACCSVWPSSA